MGFIVEHIVKNKNLVLQDNENLLYKNDSYYLVSLKMDDGRYVIYNYVSNMKKVIDITDDINKTKKMISEYFSALHDFDNLILDGEKKLSDTLHLKIIKQQNSDLNVKLIQDNKIIGSRSSSFNPLKTYFKLGILTVSGSSSLSNDFIGQGFGRKMYETIDSLLPYQQIPHGYAGSPGSLTHYSKTFWEKRKKILAFPDIKDDKLKLEKEIDELSDIDLNEDEIYTLLNLPDDKFNFRLYNSRIVSDLLYKNMGDAFTKKDAIQKLVYFKEKNIKYDLFLFSNTGLSFDDFKNLNIKKIQKKKEIISQNINWEQIEDFYNKQSSLINKSFACFENINMLFVQDENKIVAYYKKQYNDIINSHILYSTDNLNELNRIKNNIKDMCESENQKKLIAYLNKFSNNIFQKCIWTDNIESISCNHGLYNIIELFLHAKNNDKQIYKNKNTIFLLNKNDIILDSENIVPLSLEEAKILFLNLWKENVKGNIKDVFDEISCNMIDNPNKIEMLNEFSQYIFPMEISTYGNKHSRFLKQNIDEQRKQLKKIQSNQNKNNFS